jgi:hypothetical protein
VTRLLLVLLIAACSSAARSAAPSPRVAKSQPITGRIEDAVVAGHVTLVDFWSESCAACIVVGGHVAVAIATNDRIVVRKVDVGDGTTSVALDHDVSTLPHWKVYDTHKRLRYVLIGSEVLRAPKLAAELLSEP